MNPVLNGDMTARECVDATYTEIDAHNKEINAFVELTPDLAYAAADEIDARIKAGQKDELGPLAGVPVGFKDNMNLIGSKMTCCSNFLKDFESVYTATAVQRLIDAGTLPIGKTNMDEFAFGSSTETSVFGPTKNPWNLERVPGGSSGGSAAAVAARMVPIALGSDTGGSIRQPGAFTGTVALKPTYSRVSRFGVTGVSSSLDQVGSFATTVKDTALTLNAISGHDRFDTMSAKRDSEDFTAKLDSSVKGLRVAVVKDYLEADGLDPEIKASILAGVAALETQGAQIGEVSLPHSEYAISTYYIIMTAEASSNLARLDGIRYGARAQDTKDVVDLYLRTRAEGFGPETRRRLIMGTYMLSAGHYDKYFDRALRARTLVKQDFEKAFADYDIIVAPTTATTAFEFGAKQDPLTMYLSDRFTVPVNLAGVAALSMPSGLSQEGLPLSIQLISNYYDEATLLQTAAALERSYDFTELPSHVAETTA
ncbi:MAG: Asp-tRNA(Asn)/Glu-tRNA(Gln) amidotransferase subunit GatA [Coriobacteriia bacterium]|nr:Asp-tRNA(Asn)/Glu-tRNA(Gln) amidotransferase subunit GatA [Coriobacteriia bacterium]